MSADVVFGEGSFLSCLLIVFSRQKDGGSWEGEGGKREHTLWSLSLHINTFKVPTDPNPHHGCSPLKT